MPGRWEESGAGGCLLSARPWAGYQARDKAPALQKQGLPGTLSYSVSETAVEVGPVLLEQEVAEPGLGPRSGGLHCTLLE